MNHETYVRDTRKLSLRFGTTLGKCGVHDQMPLRAKILPRAAMVSLLSFVNQWFIKQRAIRKKNIYLRDDTSAWRNEVPHLVQHLTS
mgnify:CR=1 FL=1